MLLGCSITGLMGKAMVSDLGFFLPLRESTTLFMIGCLGVVIDRLVRCNHKYPYASGLP